LRFRHGHLISLTILYVPPPIGSAQRGLFEVPTHLLHRACESTDPIE
jgi:hypothetical protein